MVDFPPEENIEDIEVAFIDESPQGLWPQNQDSVVGEVRHVLAQPLQDVLDQLQLLENEGFVETSEVYLDGWEDEVNLPINPPSFSLQARRAAVLARLQTGPFTRTRRDALIESFITATFGISPSFGTEGIALTASGIPLFADTEDVSDTYRVYEDPEHFKYSVYIASGITPNAALERELQRLTPAGITLNYDNSHGNIIWYDKVVSGSGPMGYWRLDETSGTTIYDWTEQNHDGTIAGDYTLNQTSLISGTNDNGKSIHFGGTNAKISIPTASGLPIGNQYSNSIEAWIKPDNEPPVIAKTLTLSGNEITDAVRTTGTQGDGADIPGGIGIFAGTTNFIKNGGYETNVTGTVALDGHSSVARITSQHKFGTACCRVTIDGTGAGSQTITTDTGVGAVPGEQAMGSFWARSSTVGAQVTAYLTLVYTDTSTANGTSVVAPLTSTWQRIIIPTKGPVGHQVDYVLVHIDNNFSGAGTFDIDGVQVEFTDEIGDGIPVKAAPTPYVETNGAIAIRSASRVRSDAQYLIPTQGWFALKFRVGWASTVHSVLRIMDAQTGDGQYGISWLNTTGPWGFYMIRSGTGTIDNSATIIPSAFAINDIITIVGAWTPTSVKISVNGSAFVSTFNDNTYVVPATFDIGRSAFASGSDEAWMNSTALWAASGTGTLTDADAITLTNAPYTASELINALPSAASPDTIYPFVTSAFSHFSKQFVIGKENSAWISSNLNKDLYYSVKVNNAGVVSTLEVGTETELVANTDYHVVGTFDGENINVYLNGVLDNTIPAAGLIVQDNATQLTIGGDSATNFQGYIDEVAVYSKTLTPEEIAQHYSDGGGT